MKILVLILALSVSLGDLTKISKVNRYKNLGEQAYKQKDYKMAIHAYKTLVDSFSVDADPIMLNLANAYFNVKDTANASNYYNQLLASNNSSIKSVANTQLGVLKKQQKKLPEALTHFKNALKADPQNADARYDYELVKKLMKDQQDQNKDQNKKDQDKKDDQNKDQQKQNGQKQDQQQNQQQNKENQQQNQQQQSQDQQKQSQQQNKSDEQKKQEQQPDQQKQGQGKDQDKQDQAGQQQPQNTDEKGAKNQQSTSTAENLKKMNISKERAQMILEAMKNNEIQYIQQNERKPTKKADSGKPDW